jgi:hypothetical protein
MRTGPLVLSARDRRFLEQFRSQGEHGARESTRSHILLGLADSVPVAQLQRVLGVSRMVIWRTRSAYKEKGLDYALYDVSRSGMTPTRRRRWSPWRAANRRKGRRAGRFGS